jgi:hypothetical protein
MSRPTVTVVSAKGEATKDTVPVPNVFKVSSAATRTPRYDANHNRRGRLREVTTAVGATHTWEDIQKKEDTDGSER